MRSPRAHAAPSETLVTTSTSVSKCLRRPVKEPFKQPSKGNWGFTAVREKRQGEENMSESIGLGYGLDGFRRA